MRPMITLYGIPNCDTVKKARAWFDAHGLPVHFHDFKRQGVPEEALTRWIAALGHETLLNRKGTTWRGLDESARAAVNDAPGATRALLLHTSLIKRPVVEWPRGGVTVGFDPERFALLIQS